MTNILHEYATSIYHSTDCIAHVHADHVHSMTDKEMTLHVGLSFQW
jgi:hypothetical protein